MARKHNKNTAERVARLAGAGFSLTEIAELLDVPKSTFRGWVKNDDDIAEAMKGAPVRDAKHPLNRKNSAGYRRDDYPRLARRHCLLGSTDEELCQLFSICRSTLNRWRKKYPEFNQAIIDGKGAADAHVAESLYKSATGHVLKVTFVGISNGEVIKEDYEKEIAPNVSAIKYWLNNRRSDVWRERQEIEIEGAAELTPWESVVVGVAEGKSAENGDA